MSTGVVAMDMAVTLTKVALPTAASSVKYLLLLVKFLEVPRETRGAGSKERSLTRSCPIYAYVHAYLQLFTADLAVHASQSELGIMIKVRQ